MQGHISELLYFNIVILYFINREERRWREWVDDHLVHMISPNVYRTPSESLEAFHHFSDWGKWDKNFSSLQRLLVIYVGAPVMYFIGKVVKKR